MHKEKHIDYLMNYHLLPEKVLSVMNKEEYQEQSYEGNEEMLKELKILGWSFDYDLSGTIYDLKPIIF